MHLSSIHDSMPNSLIKLLNWVTNDKAFNAGDNPSEMQTDGVRKCLELIEHIVVICYAPSSWPRHTSIVKMYKDKELKIAIIFFVNV